MRMQMHILVAMMGNTRLGDSSAAPQNDISLASSVYLPTPDAPVTLSEAKSLNTSRIVTCYHNYESGLCAGNCTACLALSTTMSGTLGSNIKFP